MGLKERLLHVADGSGLVARGVVSEADVERLGIESSGRFVPDDASVGAVEVMLVSIGTGTSAARELKLLASHNGGAVDATETPAGGLHTTSAMFPVQFKAAEMPDHMGAWPRELRGVVVANGESVSLAQRFARRVAAVLLREAGF